MPTENQDYFNARQWLILTELSNLIKLGARADRASLRSVPAVTPIKEGREFNVIFQRDGESPQVRTNVSWITRKQLAVLTYRTYRAGEAALWGDIVTEVESGEGQNRKITLLNKFRRETSLGRMALAILSGAR